MKKSKFTQNQILKILDEKGAGKSITEICKAHGISEPTFYNWQTKYLGDKKIDRRSSQNIPPRSQSETPSDRVRQGNKSILELETELREWKQAFADISLENIQLKNRIKK